MIIGLTGGIGTGKSTVSSILRDLGLQVIDADQVYHELLVPGSSIMRRIRQSFGAEYFYRDGRLNRRTLGAEVFSDSKKLRLLESITHPLIKEEIDLLLSRARRTGQDTVLDHPLLFEMKMEPSVDEVWVVTSPRSLQVSRICRRNGISPKEAEERIDAQLPLEFKTAQADVVINNTGTIDDLKNIVEKIWRERRR
jgi:dephospho-CoA kinase